MPIWNQWGPKMGPLDKLKDCRTMLDNIMYFKGKEMRLDQWHNAVINLDRQLDRVADLLTEALEELEP